MIIRFIAGWGIIASASGLAAISGVLAYHGFEAMISIPFAGWIGPCVAASLIGLGIAVESEIRARHWIGAAVLGALLIGAGLLDRHSGELALKSKVETAAQANADRETAYTTAVKAKADADAIMADLATELKLLSGTDVVAIQKHIGTKPDGNWGSDTALRVATRKDQIAEAQKAASADGRKWADVVAAGKPVSELPFSLKDAELYATLITVLSIILAFAGSYVAHGPAKDEVQESERALTELEANVLDLEKILRERKSA